MTTIEPTEEQRSDAAAFYYNSINNLPLDVADWVETGEGTDNVDADVLGLARLLAEREHKLREHSEWLTTQCSKFEDANISNRETIKALNEENQRYCEQVAIEKRHYSILNKIHEQATADLDAARARIAELEAAQADWLKQHYLDLRSMKGLREREAQHLADIKARLDALFAPNGSGIVHTEGGEG